MNIDFDDYAKRINQIAASELEKHYEKPASEIADYLNTELFGRGLETKPYVFGGEILDVLAGIVGMKFTQLGFWVAKDANGKLGGIKIRKADIDDEDWDEIFIGEENKHTVRDEIIKAINCVVDQKMTDEYLAEINLNYPICITYEKYEKCKDLINEQIEKGMDIHTEGGLLGNKMVVDMVSEADRIVVQMLISAIN
jgi:hypothetical protein